MNRYIRQRSFPGRLFSASLLFLLALPAAGQVNGSKIFVRINGDKIITEHDVDIWMRSLLQQIVTIGRHNGSSQETILKRIEQARKDRWQVVVLIARDILIQQEADRMGLVIKPRLITEMLEDRLRRIGDKSFIRPEQVRTQIIRRQKQLWVTQQWKRSTPRPSPAQIEAYYRSNKDKYTQPEGYKVCYIKFRKQGTDIDGRDMTPELARRRAERVQAEAARPNADFEALVRKNSDDELSRDNGGLLNEGDGYVGPADLRAVFRQALSNMTPGDVSTVLDLGASGFALLKLEDHRSGATLPLSKVQGRIQRDLQAAAARKTLGERLRQLFEKAHICDDRGAPIPINRFLDESKDGSANHSIPHSSRRPSEKAPPARRPTVPPKPAGSGIR